MLGIGSEISYFFDTGNCKHVLAGTVRGSIGLWDVKFGLPVYATLIYSKNGTY